MTTQAAFSATRRTHTINRTMAAVVALVMLTPMLVAVRPAQAHFYGRKQFGQMTTKKKVVLLAGAALLYYLYRKHQASRNQAAPGQTASRPAQLYRSRNGGVYYRDANGKPVWLTVPNQAVQVPASDVQQYAPNYRQYRGPVPSIPRGARTENFSDYDSNVMNGSDGSAYPSGPRR